MNILLVTVLNIIWVSFSDIPEIEKLNYEQYQKTIYLKRDLKDKPLDNFMFNAEGLITFVIYTMIIVAGPIDICKKYMLRENKRIYALLLCFITGIKLGIEGLVFEEYIGRLQHHYEIPFVLERAIVIFFNCVAVCFLVTIVRDEKSEVVRGKRSSTKTTE